MLTTTAMGSGSSGGGDRNTTMSLAPPAAWVANDAVKDARAASPTLYDRHRSASPQRPMSASPRRSGMRFFFLLTLR